MLLFLSLAFAADTADTGDFRIQLSADHCSPGGQLTAELQGDGYSDVWWAADDGTFDPPDMPFTHFTCPQTEGEINIFLILFDEANNQWWRFAKVFVDLPKASPVESPEPKYSCNNLDSGPGWGWIGLLLLGLRRRRESGRAFP